MISAELRPDWERLPAGSLYAYLLQMQAILQKKKGKKGAYLANSSLFRNLTDRLPEYFCYFREDGLMRNK